MSAATLQAQLTLTRAELEVVRAERNRLRIALEAVMTGGTQPRFIATFCSHCGRGFGPSDSGYSHCRDHAGREVIA